MFFPNFPNFGSLPADRSQATYRRTDHPGPRNPTGPARARSLWLGTSLSKESDAYLSGLERVDVGGYFEPNRDGPGSTKIAVIGVNHSNPHVIDWDTAPLRDAPLY
jgi:hypothetical protein